MPVLEVKGTIEPKILLTKERINKLVDKVELQILKEISESEKLEIEELVKEFIKGDTVEVKIEAPKKGIRIKFEN